MIYGILLSSTFSSLPVSSVACQSSSGGPFESFPTSSLHSFAIGGKEKDREREREGRREKEERQKKERESEREEGEGRETGEGEREREGRREKVKRDRRRKGREEGESSVEMKVTNSETHKVARAHHLEGFDVLLLASLS